MRKTWELAGVRVQWGRGVNAEKNIVRVVQGVYAWDDVFCMPIHAFAYVHMYDISYIEIIGNQRSLYGFQ